MAPKTRAKGSKARKPKQKIECKFCINTHGDEGHSGASVRSEDAETKPQDTVKSDANVSATPLDSNESVAPSESTEVPSPAVQPACCGKSQDRVHNEQPTADELAVAEFLASQDFRSRWASGSASADVVVAATLLYQMKMGPDYAAPEGRKKAERDGTERRRSS